MIHAIKLAMTASIKVASRALDSSSFIWRQNDFILFTSIQKSGRSRPV